MVLRTVACDVVLVSWPHSDPGRYLEASLNRVRLPCSWLRTNSSHDRGEDRGPGPPPCDGALGTSVQSLLGVPTPSSAERKSRRVRAAQLRRRPFGCWGSGGGQRRRVEERRA